MSEYSMISLISMIGFLILAISAYASHRLDWKTSIKQVLIWACIFAAVVLFISVFNLA